MKKVWKQIFKNSDIPQLEILRLFLLSLKPYFSINVNCSTKLLIVHLSNVFLKIIFLIMNILLNMKRSIFIECVIKILNNITLGRSAIKKIYFDSFLCFHLSLPKCLHHYMQNDY